MKRIKALDEFENNPQHGSIDETVKSAKVKGNFEISDNMKKVAKIQKTLIDLAQLLTEMSDEIISLKINYTHMDPESMTVLSNMKHNIDNMVNSLKRVRDNGKRNGMINNCARLQRNLEGLKEDFLKKKTE